MANICEFSINVVKSDKPKILKGLNQNGEWSSIEAYESSIMDVAPPAKRERPNPFCHLF